MIFVGMEVFMGAVGVATIFLGGLGVMNVMLVSVRERTREIGVRKALGATRQSILRQFFLETVIVVFISGGAGLIISYGFCALVNLLPKFPYFDGLDASWKLAALTISLLGIIAALSALYPANRAASVDPIEALRFEAGG
jgi:putative ABC transport system permease protein